MSLRIRSEGALDHVEDAIQRYLKIEELLRFQVESVASDLPTGRVDAAMIARLERLDAAPVLVLREAQERVAVLARRQLRERGIEPTSPNIEDLLAQLIARANVTRTPRAPPEDVGPLLWLVPIFAMPLVATMLFAGGAQLWEYLASMGVLIFAAVLGYRMSRTPRV